MASQVKAQAEAIQKEIVARRPMSQQLGTLQNALTKATAAREKKLKETEAEAKLNELKAAEAQAEEALRAFKAKLMEEAKKDDPKTEENTLTNASAKFVSAILPQLLPEEAQQALQIQINQALAAIQAQITKVVTETQEAQKATELAAARAAAPVTPQLPSHGGSPPGTPSVLQNDHAKGNGSGSQEVANTQMDSTEPSLGTGFGKASATGRSEKSAPYQHPVQTWDHQ